MADIKEESWEDSVQKAIVQLKKAFKAFDELDDKADNVISRSTLEKFYSESSGGKDIASQLNQLQLLPKTFSLKSDEELKTVLKQMLEKLDINKDGKVSDADITLAQQQGKAAPLFPLADLVRSVSAR